MSNSFAHEARRAERREANAPSTLRIGGEAPVDVMVHDISETGIRFASPAALRVGDEVSIGLAGFGATRAHVAWARDGAYGCTFAAAIDPAAAAGAFRGGTVIRLGGTAPAAAAPGRTAPGPLAAQVDELYARHRRWAFPRDISVLALLALGGIAALLWPHL